MRKIQILARVGLNTLKCLNSVYERNYYNISLECSMVEQNLAKYHRSDNHRESVLDFVDHYNEDARIGATNYDQHR